MQVKHCAVVLYLLSVIAWGQNPATGSTALSPNQPNTQAAQGQPGPVPSVGLALPHYQADFGPVVLNGRVGTSWDKGYLVSFGGGTTGEPITLYDKNGSFVFEAPVSFEGAIKRYIQHATATKTGAAVVAATAVTADGAMADLIVEVGKDGIRRAIRTSPFRSLRVCATDEGTVWAYGWERDQSGGDRHGHHSMLREYSFEKGQLRSAVDRATVQPPPQLGVEGGPEGIYLKCGPTKVALISMTTNELMEYDLSLSHLTRWPMAPPPSGFGLTGAALTGSGEVYLSALRPGPRSTALTGVFHLRVNSSGTAEWAPLTIVPSEHNWFRLLGSDGESLVYARGPESPTVFWSKTAQTEVTK